jgi:hypothetical protein
MDASCFYSTMGWALIFEIEKAPWFTLMTRKKNILTFLTKSTFKISFSQAKSLPKRNVWAKVQSKRDRSTEYLRCVLFQALLLQTWSGHHLAFPKEWTEPTVTLSYLPSVKRALTKVKVTSHWKRNKDILLELLILPHCKQFNP